MADIVSGTSIYSNLKFLEKSQWWSLKDLNVYQNKKLRALIRYAYRNVPYYHKEWKKIKLNPDDIRTTADLTKIPIITKEDVKSNFNAFKSGNMSDNKFNPSSTGGSTGEPLSFLCDWNAWSIGWACLYRGWGFGGYNVGDKIVTIGGSSLVPSKRPSFKKRIKDRVIERHLGVSAFDMSEDNMGEYCKIINKYKPLYLRGYATSLYIFAKFCRDNDISFSTLRGIFSTAENLFPQYRKEIEDSLGVEVFNEYGVRDGGGHAAECRMHSGQHISLERSVMEFVRDKENVSSNEMGSIILTDLHNYSFPFIRYEVGDMGTSTGECCSCGRGLPLVKRIDGRITEIIRFSDGTMWSGPVLTLVFAKFDIKQYQVVQNDEDKILLKIVKGNTFSNIDEYNLIQIFNYHVGKHGSIEIEYVDEIPVTKSGKRKFIISKITN